MLFLSRVIVVFSGYENRQHPLWAPEGAHADTALARNAVRVTVDVDDGLDPADGEAGWQHLQGDGEAARVRHHARALGAACRIDDVPEEPLPDGQPAAAQLAVDTCRPDERVAQPRRRAARKRQVRRVRDTAPDGQRAVGLLNVPHVLHALRYPGSGFALRRNQEGERRDAEGEDDGGGEHYAPAADAVFFSVCHAFLSVAIPNFRAS